MIKIHLSRILGERRITQKQLAEATNLRATTINDLYHEKTKRLNLDALDRICTALDCQPHDIVERIGDAPDVKKLIET